VKGPESREQSIGRGYKYLATGLRFAGGIVVFFFGGFFLDRWLGTTPLFLIVGTLVGAGLGFLSVYRELLADEARRADGQTGRRAGGQ
jgi:F0F1-type ATP synthase assembly protein I